MPHLATGPAGENLAAVQRQPPQARAATQRQPGAGSGATWSLLDRSLGSVHSHLPQALCQSQSLGRALSESPPRGSLYLGPLRTLLT